MALSALLKTIRIDEMRGDDQFTLATVARGTWYMIHLVASQGNEPLLRSIIQTLRENFICGKCRKHIGEYVDNNHLLHSQNAKELFDWTFKFHNAVSSRIGKPVLDENQGNKIFANLTTINTREEDCVKNCDGVILDNTEVENQFSGADFVSY